MRVRFSSCWLPLGLIVSGTGCNLVSNTHRTMVNEPLLATDEFILKHRFKKLAHDSFAEFKRGGNAPKCSPCFKEGYIDGFIDQLENGGTTDPPAQPPRHYWTAGNLTPQGQERASMYFDGFRTGAEMALASGLRRAYQAKMFVPDASLFSSHIPRATRPGDSSESALPAPRSENLSSGDTP